MRFFRLGGGCDETMPPVIDPIYDESLPKSEQIKSAMKAGYMDLADQLQKELTDEIVNRKPSQILADNNAIAIAQRDRLRDLRENLTKSVAILSEELRQTCIALEAYDAAIRLMSSSAGEAGDTSEDD